MSFSVRPRVGADYLIAGDAMGAINPFNGEGIAYGWETGRFAADTLTAALGCANESDAAATLAGYETRLAEEYARYYAIAKAFVKVIEEPKVMRALVAAGMYVPPVMKGVLRIMANLNRPDRRVGSEALYLALVKLSEARDRQKGRAAPAGWPQIPAQTY
jgi:flavin-dependent dehydrogenase